jgi:hypothetical protein
MKTTPEQMVAVRDALCSMLDEKTADSGAPVGIPCAELDEALRRFFLEKNEFASLEEFVDLLCRHLS